VKRFLLTVLVTSFLMHFAIAQKADNTANSGFSFDVYGDSRSMMYLPYKASQEAEARKLMVDMFNLVLPEIISEYEVHRHVKLIYDPSTHELIQSLRPRSRMSSCYPVCTAPCSGWKVASGLHGR